MHLISCNTAYGAHAAYANSLIVGNTFRPIFDRMLISREKLSYIVDATSAPIASVSPISSWIGALLV